MVQGPSWEANRFSPALDGTPRFIAALQVSATSPYPEPDQSSPCPPILFP